VQALCAVRVSGREYVASGGEDGVIRVWDPATHRLFGAVTGHDGWVQSLCTVWVEGREHFASGGEDGVVRVWDPATGRLVRELTGHTGWVPVLCPVRIDGRNLLASGSNDRSVRLWDLERGDQVMALPVASRVWALTAHLSTLLIGMDTGIKRLRLSRMDSVNGTVATTPEIGTSDSRCS
jgi:WD40 repeat protein